MASFKEISISTDYIKLSQFLKKQGLISTGGEDKIFLANNKVLVNSNGENRRGKKLFKGDLVEINGEVYKIC